jgi:hypothetical protein
MNWTAAGVLATWTLIVAAAFTYVIRAEVDRAIKNLNGTYVKKEIFDLKYDELLNSIELAMLKHSKKREG